MSPIFFFIFHEQIKLHSFFVVVFFYMQPYRPCNVSFFTMPVFFLPAGCSACGHCPQFRWGLHSCLDVTIVGQRRAIIEGG